MRGLRILVALLSGACVLPSTSSSAPAPDASISDTDRAAVIDSLEDLYLASLRSGAMPADAALEVVAAMNARTDVWLVAQSNQDGDVWGTFLDGTLWSLVDADPDATLAGVPAPPADADKPVAGRAVAPRDLVAGATYRVFNALDDTGWNTTPWVAKLTAKLEARGYTKSAGDIPFTPRDLRGPPQKGGGYATRAIPGSFIFIGTHGLSTDVGFVYWTAEPTTVKAPDDYRNDLSYHYIARASSVRTSDGSKEEHWGITPLFVQRYLRLDPGAIVYAQVCKSANVAMTDAVLAAGAGRYLGFNETVPAKTAVVVLYELMGRALGSPFPDEDFPRFMVPPEVNVTVKFPAVGLPAPTNAILPQPPVRAFDLNSLMTAMAPLPQTGTVRLLIAGPTKPPVSLAPGIEYLQLDPSDTSTLQVIGDFGDNQDAHLFVGGTEYCAGQLTFTAQDRPGNPSLNPTMATCKIPDDAAGAVHMVVHGIQSNDVPLTDWRGTFTYTGTTGGYTGTALACNVTVTLDLHLRGDVHLYRATPDVAAANSLALTPAPDSRMTYTISGTASNGSGTLDCSDNTATSFATGATTNDPPYGGFSAQLNWRDSTLQSARFGFVVNGKATYTSVGGAVEALTVQATVAGDAAAPKLLLSPGTFVIQAGSVGGSAVGKLTWPAIAPKAGTIPVGKKDNDRGGTPG